MPAPNLERLKSRLHTRLEAVRAQKARGLKAPNEKLVKRQEERHALADAAKRAYEARVDRMWDEHKPFRVLLKTLDRELPDTDLIEQGVVDIDLAHLVTSLGVHKLPLEARQLAVSEVHTFIRRVHKRRTGSVVTCNVEKLFKRGWLDSLDEVKLALSVH